MSKYIPHYVFMIYVNNLFKKWILRPEGIINIRNFFGEKIIIHFK